MPAINSPVITRNAGQLIALSYRLVSGSYQQLQIPIICRQKGDGSWEEIAEDSTFQRDLNHSVSGFSQLFSWNGDLYFAASGGIWTGASSFSPLGVKIYRYSGSGTTWTDMTPSGLGSTSPWRRDNLSFSEQNFAEINGSLYFFWNEDKYPQAERLSVARLDGNSWTRMPDFAINADGPKQIVSNGSKAWLFQSGIAAGITYTYAPGSGFSTVASSDTDWFRSSAESSNLRLVMNGLRVVDGVGAFAFSRYRQGLPVSYADDQQYFYIAKNTSGSTWDRVRYDRPQAGSNARQSGYRLYDGKEFIALGGQGPGMSINQAGIWLYRKDGSSWTMLGGGSARSGTSTYTFPGIGQTLQSPGGVTQIEFWGGAAHLVFTERIPDTGSQANESLVIAKTAA